MLLAVPSTWRMAESKSIVLRSGILVFAMSTDLFLTHLVAPGLPQVFGGGANPGCFGYDPAKHVITAAHGFGTSSVKEGAIWYTPQVTSLSLGVVGGALAGVDALRDLLAARRSDWQAFAAGVNGVLGLERAVTFA